jgi:hypothetical protein
LEKAQCLEKTLYTAPVTLRRNLTALLGYGDNAYRLFCCAWGNTALDRCSMIMIQAKDKPFSMGSKLFIEGPWYFDYVKVA